MHLDILDQEYTLTNDQIQFYEENRFIKLKNVLTPEIIQFFNTVITEKVNVHAALSGWQVTKQNR